MTTLDVIDLARVTGAGNTTNLPLSGDVTQQINTNWGGTQIIHPPAARPSPLRFEQLRQNPQLRFGPPPYVNRPVRRR